MHHPLCPARSAVVGQLQLCGHPTLYFCPSSKAISYFQPRLVLHTLQKMSATCDPATSMHQQHQHLRGHP